MCSQPALKRKAEATKSHLAPVGATAWQGNFAAVDCRAQNFLGRYGVYIYINMWYLYAIYIYVFKLDVIYICIDSIGRIPFHNSGCPKIENKHP